jgi:ATP-binding cassette, subfamily B, multidrug efflux pump
MFTWFERRIDPFESVPVVQPPARLIGFYWHYIRPVWPAAAVLLTLDFLLAISEVALTKFLADVVDLVGKAQSPAAFVQDNLWLLVSMGVVIVLVRPLLAIAYELTRQHWLLPLQARIRWQSHSYLLRQSLGFFTGDFAGRLANKVMQTAQGMRDTLILLSDAVVYVTVQWTAALVLFIATDWRLAIPLLVWLFLYAVGLVYFVPRIRQRATAASEARSALLGRIVDSYTNILTVKLFAHSDRESVYVREAITAQLEKHRDSVRVSTVMSALLHTMNGLLIVATASIAVWLWSTGTATAGAIVLTIGLVVQMTRMSTWVMNLVTNIFENIGTVHEGMETMSRPIAVADKPRARELEAAHGEINFQSIGFNYGSVKGTPNADPSRVIDGLNLTIRAGEKIGLVGRSGSGKSTLVNLLLRFYDVEKGSIRIDGQNIQDLTQESLRSQIGMVTQDTSLLHRSVAENILYGRPDAGLDAAITAAKRAHAHDFILQLEDTDGRKGYDARVGERGVKLSGGQRQRIAIARVLLKDAPILILDEATSALDSEAEAAIQDQLGNLMSGKTVIAIAHRLSTIAAMDRLIVLDMGRIVEQGSHAELLHRDGIYARLWARQSGGFMTKEVAE